MKSDTQIIEGLVAQYQKGDMTIDALTAALKTDILNKLLCAEAESQSTALVEKTGNPTMGYRNGYKQRSLKTLNGKLILDKPQLRNAIFTTTIFDRYSRVDKALENVVRESYILGVSTTKVTKLVEGLGITDLSPSTVSRIAKELDTDIQFFLNRPISLDMPYVFIDATYVKIRNGGRYINKAIFVAYGINSDGFREILGMKIALSESESFWDSFFDELINRGLSGVKLVISDGHKGIQAAVEKKFLGCSWQMCIVHLKRAVIGKVPRKIASEVSDILMQINLGDVGYQRAIAELDELHLKGAADVLRKYEDSACNYLAFPKKHHRRIYTTNGLERVNREIKRRVNAVGTFPNDASAFRLIGAILMNIDEEWATGKLYLDMTSEEPVTQ